MSSDPRIGTLIGEYRVDSLLGRGGMSVVYLAEHVRLKRKAAVKLLSPELADDATFRARFVSEWERLAALDHPNIIPIFEAGESEAGLYIAMRYVETTDLKALIGAEGRLDAERTVQIIGQTASALDAAHARSLVHRDVKPANILVAIGAGAEGADHAYLSDFGLTKHTESTSGLTKTGHFMGTIDYVAPEQIAGKGVDGRTDQYALACVTYECLTGRVPFPREEETASLFAHLQDPPPRTTEARPDLPPAIDDVIAKGMAKDKESRYGSCTEFARATRAALGLSVVHTPPVGPSLVQETVLAAPPPPPAPAAAATSAPVAPAAAPSPPSAPPPPPAPGARAPARGRWLGIGAGALVVIAVAIFALTRSGDQGGPSGGTGSTGATGTTGGGPTGSELAFGIGATEVLDDFSDPGTGWETGTQNGIARSYEPDGTYRFTITSAAGPNAFSVSAGPGRAVSLRDTYVKATVRVVDKGGAGLLNSIGVGCRTSGTSSYYLLIGVSGRWAIEKLAPGGDTSVLANGRDVAVAPGEATNVLEARCFDLADGTAHLQLLVNGKQVGEAVDDAPLGPGAGTLAVTGQAGFVAAFDDVQVSELSVSGPGAS